ncbi:MAG: sugar phosphate isomerase/epimerase [Bacteroidia bacterium]|nr:sugar phosphate isomerase/epimerase [Bacteroidia bacterium]
MKIISRRQFIGKSMLGLGSVTLLSQLPLTGRADMVSSHPRHPVGFQVYTIREMLVKDFPGTLKMMAKLGYQGVEMCSPPGYITSGFEPLVKMKPELMRKIITDAGLLCESSHFTFGELKDNLGDRIEFATKLGLTQMIASSFGLPKEATMSDWLKAADQLNEIGLKTKKAGIQLGFHNHNMEFEKIDGELIYDALFKQFDPELIKMQFQVAVISIGYKASTYFLKYPGRFISAHLADWSTSENKQVTVGKGVVDWGEFYNAAEIGGVKNFYVEMDMVNLKDSAVNIQAM